MPSKPPPADGRLRLSVVIAAYNEEGTLESVVDRVRQIPLDVEIIAVNDGSSDGTGAALDRLLAEGKVAIALAPSPQQGERRGAADRHRGCHR